MSGPDFKAQIEAIPHDVRDPHPFLALYLDRSVPLDEEAKAAVLVGMTTPFRQFCLPFIRPLARGSILLIQCLKAVLPWTAAPKTLHRVLYLGLRYFVHPQANWLILRHFHIGSELLAFVEGNVDVRVELNPLTPTSLSDLKDNLFLKHDLNLFNFVINLNRTLRDQGEEVVPRAEVDYSMITDGEFGIGPMPRGWFNIVDLESAIELFTPVYQLLLTDHDFWRASNSLQLDETVAIYAAQIRGDANHLHLLNNKHPLVPLATWSAGFRLMLHGLAAECLHMRLREEKAAQAAGREAVGVSAAGAPER